MIPQQSEPPPHAPQPQIMTVWHLLHWDVVVMELFEGTLCVAHFSQHLKPILNQSMVLDGLQSV